MNTTRYKGTCWGDVNVLKLDFCDGCIALDIYLKWVKFMVCPIKLSNALN